MALFDDDPKQQFGQFQPRHRIMSSGGFNSYVVDTYQQYDDAYMRADEFESFLDEIAEEFKELDEVADFIAPQNCVNDISTEFQYMRQLGCGASCRVLKAVHLENGKIYALKEMQKNNAMSLELFCKEVELLKKLMHPNILRFFDCFMDNHCYYIATEFCSGGTMLERIVASKSFSELQASQYIRTILNAVKYMHELNIVHRDLKVQNMVFDKPGKDGLLQIIDFGDSLVVDDEKIYHECVGTIFYLPPEIMRARTGKELKKSDMWMVGVITYLLVCGRPPFTGKTHREILQKITSEDKNKIEWPQKIALTDSCKHFISSLLCNDTNKRLDVESACKHPWIAGKTASNKSFSCEFLDLLSKYSYNNKLQHIIVNAVLSEMDESEADILHRGIMDVNQRRKSMNGSAVVDYLLLHSEINQISTVPSVRNKKWQQRRMSEIEEKFQQRPRGGVVTSPTVTSPKLDAMMPINEDNDDDEWLEEFDVDGIVAEIDHHHKKSALLQEDEFVDLPLKITVDKFKQIMMKSNKKYDVNEIANDLDDGSGHIAFNDINAYRKRIVTVGSSTFKKKMNPLL